MCDSVIKFDDVDCHHEMLTYRGLVSNIYIDTLE